jgi:hypothetical protein
LIPSSLISKLRRVQERSICADYHGEMAARALGTGRLMSGTGPLLRPGWRFGFLFTEREHAEPSPRMLDRR